MFNRPREWRRSHAAPRQRRIPERGAAALEFALVAPVFFALIFGGIEIGLMFRSHLALENMSRSAARVASVERNDVDADRAILESINREAQPLSGDITRVVIFSAETLDSEISAGCRTARASEANVCNVYLPDVRGIQGILDDDVFESALTGVERAEWKNLGVYIEYDYAFATGFFDSMTLSASSVEVVELNL